MNERRRGSESRKQDSSAQASLFAPGTICRPGGFCAILFFAENDQKNADSGKHMIVHYEYYDCITRRSRVGYIKNKIYLKIHICIEYHNKYEIVDKYA